MEKRIDFTKMGLTAKNSTKVKEYAKKQLNEFIMEKVREYYGDANVSEVFKDGKELKGYLLVWAWELYKMRDSRWKFVLISN